MTGKTHVVGGLATGLLFLYVNDDVVIREEVPFLAATVIGSLLPDICSPNSKIGRKLPILSRIASGTFGHRTFTHSLLMLVLLHMSFTKLLEWPFYIEHGLMLGIVSHLVLDALTRKGIQFLWPLPVRVGVPFGIKTDGFIEPIFLAGLFLSILYMGNHLYF